MEPRYWRRPGKTITGTDDNRGYRIEARGVGQLTDQGRAMARQLSSAATKIFSHLTGASAKASLLRWPALSANTELASTGDNTKRGWSLAPTASVGRCRQAPINAVHRFRGIEAVLASPDWLPRTRTGSQLDSAHRIPGVCWHRPYSLSSAFSQRHA